MYLKTGGQRLLLTCLAVTVIYKARVKNLICKLLTLIIIEESNLQRFSHSLLYSYLLGFIHFHFPGQDLLIIFIILLKQLRRVQLVGTLCHALIAVETVFDFFHVLLPLFA